MQVFLSYRRAASGLAKELDAQLVHYFRRVQVFHDVSGITAGAHQRDQLWIKIAYADAVIALIGAGWCAEFKRRAFTEDWVLFELTTALDCRQKSPIPRPIILPVLAPGVRMPRRSEMPAALVPLAEIGAVSLSGDWKRDIATIAQTLRAPGWSMWKSHRVAPTKDSTILRVRERRYRLTGSTEKHLGFGFGPHGWRGYQWGGIAYVPLRDSTATVERALALLPVDSYDIQRASNRVLVRYDGCNVKVEFSVPFRFRESSIERNPLLTLVRVKAEAQLSTRGGARVARRVVEHVVAALNRVVGISDVPPSDFHG